MQESVRTLFIYCAAMCCLQFCACSGGLGENKQHSTPALDSLLADTALLGDDAIAPSTETRHPEQQPSGIKPAKITLQNDLDYSANFLKKLTYANLAEHIELADSFMIFEQIDTFVFPMVLKMGEWTNFMANKQGYLYSLDVSLSNYTTLDFNFELRKGRQTVDQLKGKADLNPGFVLAAETDEDPVTGTEYVSMVYEFESKGCVFNIRIGNDEGIKKVKLFKQCNPGKYPIALEDCPVLLEK